MNSNSDLPGSRLDNSAYLEENNISKNQVAVEISKVFNQMIFGYETCGLHCDPHLGNVAIRTKPSCSNSSYNFEIILYDHGLYRQIPIDTQRNYARLWLAILKGDLPAMRKYSHIVAGIPEDKFPLFASAITGRDFKVLAHSINTSKTEEENSRMRQAVSGRLLGDLIQLLSDVPRLILLILKTNDLMRALDESLKATMVPERNYFIIGKYCANCLYEEQLESIKCFDKWRLISLWDFAKAWSEYNFTKLRLSILEICLTIQRTVLSVKVS